MTQDEFAYKLGKLVGNILSLEFLLRAFLQNLPTAQPLGLLHKTDIYSFPVGSELPENELTNYKQLGTLIKNFNDEMARRRLSPIDPTIVDIRDAIHHGRASSSSLNSDVRLLKFDYPKNRKVHVVFNEILSDQWFKDQTKRVYTAIQLVAKLHTP